MAFTPKISDRLLLGGLLFKYIIVLIILQLCAVKRKVSEIIHVNTGKLASDHAEIIVEYNGDHGKLRCYHIGSLLELCLALLGIGCLVSSLDQPYPMVYERWNGDDKCLVVINPSAKKVSVELPTYGVKDPQPIGGYYKKVTYKAGKTTDKITIDGVSAVIYQL